MAEQKNQGMRLKELSVELRDRIVSRHRSGEWYQKMLLLFNIICKNTIWSTFGMYVSPPHAHVHHTHSISH